MSNIISYFKTAKGRSSIKWIVAIVVLIIVCIYLFRKVQNVGSNDPLVKALKYQNDSLTKANSKKDADILIYKQANDSLITALDSKEVLIQEKKVYIEKEVIRWRYASTYDIERFFPDRFDR